MKFVALVVCLLLAVTAEAQDRPFVFTVTTGPSDADSDRDSRPWTAYYDSGYAERTSEPFGYDGVEQRFGMQGRLGAGFSLVGHVGLGIGDSSGHSSQQAEVLKDVLGASSRVRFALGAGGRREWDGTNAALARVCLGWNSGKTVLSGNVLLEKPFVAGRDQIDLITTFGWMRGVGHGLRVGVEAVGEDLEGFWDAEEAEGGAKLYAGPTLHWTAPAGRLWLAASGGPIVYATRSPRVSAAPRPLDTAGNGFTVRVSIGYAF